MIRLAQQGKIETILSNKEPIELHNLFLLPPLVVLPPPPPGRVCLIEGAPGVGKSTLALHICHQWAQGASWLTRFDVVVLAYLRDEAVQNAITLADILPAKESSSQFIIPQLQASCGDGVHSLYSMDGTNFLRSSHEGQFTCLHNNSSATQALSSSKYCSYHLSTSVFRKLCSTLPIDE